METATDRKDALKLFDTLNEYVERTREEAEAAGLKEGADDGEDDDEEEDAEADEEAEEDIPDMGEDRRRRRSTSKISWNQRQLSWGMRRQKWLRKRRKRMKRRGMTSQRLGTPLDHGRCSR